MKINKNLLILFLALLILIQEIGFSVTRPPTTIPPIPPFPTNGDLKEQLIWLKDVILNILNLHAGGAAAALSLTPGQFVLLLIFAFVSTWIIVYGFLTQLAIFGRRRGKLYLLLSFFITTMASVTGYLRILVLSLFNIMAAWSVGIFTLMFMVGTWLIYKKRTAEWATGAATAAAYQSDIESLRGDLAEKRMELADLRNKIARTAEPNKRASLEAREQKIKQELQSLQDRIQELAESYRS